MSPRADARIDVPGSFASPDGPIRRTRT